MIKLSDNLWVGGSDDSLSVADLDVAVAVLNVACDLDRDWRIPSGVTYTQVGLVDGPGNELSDYCAAVLCLKGMLRRNDHVLVYDHDGGRALVVALIYLQLDCGQVRRTPMAWSHWPTWAERFTMSVPPFQDDLPDVHDAHVEAFGKIPWGVLEAL